VTGKHNPGHCFKRRKRCVGKRGGGEGPARCAQFEEKAELFVKGRRVDLVFMGGVSARRPDSRKGRSKRHPDRKKEGIECVSR